MLCSDGPPRIEVVTTVTGYTGYGLKLGGVTVYGGTSTSESGKLLRN